MAASDILVVPGNKLHEESLFYDDGTTPLLLTSLSLLQLQVYQHNRLLATYLYGTDPELREGSSTSILEFEITTELSQRFNEGLVVAKLTMEMDDADFTVDERFISPKFFDLVTVQRS